MAKIFRFGILIPLLFSCNIFTNPGDTNKDILLLDDAESRYKQVQKVRYDLKLQIGDEENFTGKVKIYFNLNHLNSPLRFDFHRGKIDSIYINGEEKSVEYKEGFFTISSNLLKLENNIVEINYSHPYSHSGNGLHQFKDPEDGETYLYSQFESFHANQMFPCFDQPDLKATYKLEVIAPSKWKVISSTLATSIETKDKFLSLHSFPESKKFSTYIFSLHAGPYAEWNDTSYKIPLRLFSRKSNSKYIDSKFWFQVTKQGFVFFEDYFGIEYPFQKYDQLIVPEFNFGAMENVAAVTFTERLLSRGTVTRRAKEKIANVILHEMAHMWFGNLVTMKWWDGLWLNESFATYMAAKAQYEATEFKEAWETFYTGMKAWAYSSDRSSTTHPIQAKINDTEEAFVNFDGITYGKGASVLKQLEYFVGDKNFQAGVSAYLKKYSYSNAKLSDFLFSIEESSKKDLAHWSKEWLEKEGTNTLSYKQNCKANQLQSIELHQGNGPTSNILRSHRTKLAFINFKESKPEIYKIVEAEYRGSVTKLEFQNSENISCPDFVFLNYGDYDFVRSEIQKEFLKESNLNTLKLILSDHGDLLQSLMLWRNLFEEVKDGNLKLKDYNALAMEELPKDPRDLILESNLGHITSGNYISYHSFLYFKHIPERDKILSDLENFIWANMANSKSNSDRKRFWFQNYISVGSSKEFHTRSANILENRELVAGLTIDQDLRWSLLKKICSFHYDDKLTKKLLNNELKRDKSKFGSDNALACEAAHPDPVTKSKWMSILVAPTKEYSAATLRTVMYTIFPIHQKNLQIPFVEFFYNNVENNKIGGDENYLETYSEMMAPQFCTEENKHILKKFLSHSKKIPATVRKNLELNLEAEEDCVLVRKSDI